MSSIVGVGKGIPPGVGGIERASSSRIDVGDRDESVSVTFGTATESHS